jgi:hypothetical protein
MEMTYQNEVRLFIIAALLAATLGVVLFHQARTETGVAYLAYSEF